MAKFSDGKVYMIINDEDITTEMINYSTSKSKEEMPLKTVAGVDKRILETLEPVRDVYSSYYWYSKDEINTIWDGL